MYTRPPISSESARADESGRAPATESPKAAVPKAAPVDRYGDPLPPHAVARFGTLRFRHEWTLFATAVSPDGRLLAGSGGNSVQIWDAQTGRTVQRLPSPGYGCEVVSLAFSADGKNLASYEEVENVLFKGQVEELGRLRISDVATGKTIRLFDRAKRRAPTRSLGSPYLAFLPKPQSALATG
jgi:hypothetical protein